MSHTIYSVDARKEKTLKEICFQAVRKHFVALGTASLVGEYETRTSTHACSRFCVCVEGWLAGFLFIIWYFLMECLPNLSRSGLPTHLIEDLLPHLTVCQLDELQPLLNHRGNTCATL